MAWIVETLNETVDAELAELPADMRPRLARIAELIELASEGEGVEAMIKIRDLQRGWSRDGDYKAAYEGLEGEFRLARALIEARTAAGLSQSQLARRMKTSQSYIARIEGGKVRPSTDALERFASDPHAPSDHLRT